MKIIEVEWVDSCAVNSGAWADKEAVRELEVENCKSVGYLIADEKTYLVIAAHEATNQYGGEMCIPKVAITKVTTIRDHDD